MRAVVIANGKLDEGGLSQAEIRPDDLIICADGGVQNALALGVTPHVVLGDFDSASQAAAHQAADEARHVVRPKAAVPAR